MFLGVAWLPEPVLITWTHRKQVDQPSSSRCVDVKGGLISQEEERIRTCLFTHIRDFGSGWACSSFLSRVLHPFTGYIPRMHPYLLRENWPVQATIFFWKWIRNENSLLREEWKTTESCQRHHEVTIFHHEMKFLSITNAIMRWKFFIMRWNIFFDDHQHHHEMKSFSIVDIHVVPLDKKLHKKLWCHKQWDPSYRGILQKHHIYTRSEDFTGRKFLFQGNSTGFPHKVMTSQAGISST